MSKPVVVHPVGSRLMGSQVLHNCDKFVTVTHYTRLYSLQSVTFCYVTVTTRHEKGDYLPKTSCRLMGGLTTAECSHKLNCLSELLGVHSGANGSG